MICGLALFPGRLDVILFWRFRFILFCRFGLVLFCRFGLVLALRVDFLARRFGGLGTRFLRRLGIVALVLRIYQRSCAEKANQKQYPDDSGEFHYVISLVDLRGIDLH